MYGSRFVQSSSPVDTLSSGRQAARQRSDKAATKRLLDQSSNGLVRSQKSGWWHAVTGCVSDQKVRDSEAFGQEILLPAIYK